MLLRKSGDVSAEPLRDGSYRWSVVLEPEDVVSDPMGLYRVRTVPAASTNLPPHGKNAMPLMAKTPCPHGKNAMPLMAKTPWGVEVVDKGAAPCPEPSEVCPGQPEKEPLKISLKDTCSKIHQQKMGKPTEASRDDDEALDYKKLLGELLALGTGQRIARKLLREHDHQLVINTLERVRCRTDLDNPAGYLVREIEDGGYEDTSLSVKSSDSVSRESSAKPQVSGYERTKVELEALETEKARKEAVYRQEVQALLQRFQALPDDLKARLKTQGRVFLETLVPNTPKKAMLMAEQRFQKIAFKEVATHFFALLDQGLSPDRALAQLAA
jgi:hypothetical protein